METTIATTTEYEIQIRWQGVWADDMVGLNEPRAYETCVDDMASLHAMSANEWPFTPANMGDTWRIAEVRR
jgi:hypothetical protein